MNNPFLINPIPRNIDQLILMAYERDREQGRSLTAQDKRIERRSWLATRTRPTVKREKTQLEKFREWQAQ